jgi:3-deoxy-7-phosphoheptulonate synthase
MIEVHNDPPRAKCDGAQSLTPENFDKLAQKLNILKKAMSEA